MNLDFRVGTGFLTHRKTFDLRCQHGDTGIVALQRLWTHCALTAVDGVVRLPDRVIEEEIMHWHGGPGFVSDLVAIGFLDRIEGGVAVHNWAKWNPYCAAAQQRIEKARSAGKASAAARTAKHGTAQPFKPLTGSKADEDPPELSPNYPFGDSRTSSSSSVEPPTQPDPTRPDPTGSSQEYEVGRFANAG